MGVVVVVAAAVLFYILSAPSKPSIAGTWSTSVLLESSGKIGEGKILMYLGEDGQYSSSDQYGTPTDRGHYEWDGSFLTTHGKIGKMMMVVEMQDDSEFKVTKLYHEGQSEPANIEWTRVDP